MARKGPPKGTPRVPGSGRRVGTPNKATADIRALAQAYGARAIAALAGMAGLVKGVPSADSEQAKAAALRELLNRGYGQSTQLIAGENGGPAFTVNVVRFADGH